MLVVDVPLETYCYHLLFVDEFLFLSGEMNQIPMIFSAVHDFARWIVQVPGGSTRANKNAKASEDHGPQELDDVAGPRGA